MQSLQSEAGQPSGGSRGFARTGGNDHQLLELRQRNHGAVQTDPGATGLLQGVLPVPQVCGRRRPVTPAVLLLFLAITRENLAPPEQEAGARGIRPLSRWQN